MSFHVGSQQTDLGQWDEAIGAAAQMFSLLAAADINLRMVNIGGGFPAQYRADVSPVSRYAGAVTAALTKHFGNRLPEVIVEPGRSMVGDAGIIQSEVVLISDKGDDDDKRWVYLDVGKFNGLAETMDESIKYRIETPGRDGETGPVVIAGPTCDSADILYEKTEYKLPLGLKVGDKVEILSTGAYTVELCLGRVQRLRADADVLHLRLGHSSPLQRAPSPASGGGRGGVRPRSPWPLPAAGEMPRPAGDLLHQLAQHRLGEGVRCSARRCRNRRGPPTTLCRNRSSSQGSSSGSRGR